MSIIKKLIFIRVYRPENGYLAIILEDITQSKKQSEEQYKKLANNITDIFFAVDSSLKFTYWNKTTEKYTKITSEKAIGKHVYEILGRDKPVEEQLNCFLVL